MLEDRILAAYWSISLKVKLEMLLTFHIKNKKEDIEMLDLLLLILEFKNEALGAFRT